ncbi:uncharacterized protein [Typha latifolia]|uniref:uncharacterized protein isoform X2 n=1 Tax=Typha latifolia TaxID=4733 RepID=UPI003C2E24C5
MAAADSMAESPAIRKLGHLFKLTEVYLWEKATGVNKSSKNYNRDCSPEDEAEVSLATVDTNSPRKQTVDGYSYIEDWELACQMDALGLPVSFSTSKEKKSMTISGKKKGMRVKSLSSDNPVDNAAPTVSKVSEWENIGPSRVCHDYKSIPFSCKATEGYSEASNCKVEEVPEQLSLYGQGEECDQGYICSQTNASEAEVLNLSEVVNVQLCDEMIEETRSDNVVRETKCSDIASQSNAEFMENDFLGNEIKGTICEPCQEGQSYKKDDKKRYQGFSSISCDATSGNCGPIDIQTLKPSISSVELSLSDHGVQNSDNSIHFEYGDWRVIWDAFYMRNYFYNVKTQESTWCPPSGLEDFAFSSSTYADIEEGAQGLQDTSYSFQENKNDDDYINQTLKDISSKMHNAIEKEVSELDIRKNLDKQEQNVVCQETFNVPDFSLENLTNRRYVEKKLKVQKNFIKRFLYFHYTFVLANVCFLGSTRITIDEILSNENIENQVSTTDGLDSYYGIATTKKKKRVRRLQSHHTLRVIEGLSADIIKYWSQRYLLFSHFDKGIKMDEEGWFSVTPEPIARHHASRCGSGTIIDCFTGVGGNAIQFAMKSNHVIAIDIDPQKVDYAQHNAAIYGVANQIDFIVGDFFQMAPCLKGETAFMSPPWGGPDYAKVEIYDISTMLKPRDGYFLFKLSRMIASRLVMFLPRNVNLNQLAELALSVEPPWSLEVEKNFLNGKLKAITAYFEMR